MKIREDLKMYGGSMNIAEKLTLLRKEKGLTQEDVSRIFNISLTAVRNYENVNNVRIPKNEILIKMAKYYDVSLEFLLDDTVSNRKYETIDIEKELGLNDNTIKEIKEISEIFNEELNYVINNSFFYRLVEITKIFRDVKSIRYYFFKSYYPLKLEFNKDENKFYTQTVKKIYDNQVMKKFIEYQFKGEGIKNEDMIEKIVIERDDLKEKIKLHEEACYILDAFLDDFFDDNCLVSNNIDVLANYDYKKIIKFQIENINIILNNISDKNFNILIYLNTLYVNFKDLRQYIDTILDMATLQIERSFNEFKYENIDRKYYDKIIKLYKEYNNDKK